MLGGLHTDLLVTVTLLLLAQTGTRCRAENDFSFITLPEGRPNSEYVTVCYSDRQNNQICDWTRNRLTSGTGDAEVDILESAPLEMEGEACLEFWYRAPFAAEGSELRALVKSSTRLVEIWTSPALPGDSWRQVFIPLNIIEPETKVVFEAVQAVSMEQQIAFHRIGVRRGSCGQQCESNTEFWTDESTRCLCSAGQLSCSPSRCPEGQICGPQRSPSGGISTSGMCTIHSNTDCSTFDGVLFRFMAPCTYTLAKTCSPAGALPVFSVAVVNEQNGNASLPAVQQVIVEIGNLRVSLLRRQTDRVVVKGVWRKLPLKLGGGAVNIKGNPAVVTLETKFGLSVSYDNGGAVHINLPPAYSDHVCGMCGNFNHHRGDDFRRPDGTDAQDAAALAESWQTGESAVSCETILVPHECDPMEEAEYAGELYCGGLLSSTGPFADCLSILGAESYFRGCVVGMCSTHGDQEVLCATLKAYADICQEAGVALPVWRNSSFCPLQCSVNSHYNSCADGCPEVCSGQDMVGSCGSCEERCECDSGFKLSGGKCVPAEDCGCVSGGKHYERGEEWLEGECSLQCQCMADGFVACSDTECARNEVCRVEEGVKGCFPLNAATCSVYGDPHYITFDGMAYDFQGGCSYTLTTTCGDESSVQFTVIGHNMHPPLGNFTRSKLEAATLQTDDLNVTLSQSGEVHVNDVPVPLPFFSKKGSSSSIWVFTKGNYIILETTFGLRMMIEGENRLFLQVDERYKYELCGLCGTYSEQQDDDFVTPGGQNATGAFEFANSWRVQDNNECVSHPNDPRLCDYDEENDAYNECYALLGDAFRSCHKVIHPSIYLSSCVYDYCATSGDKHTLCESLESYAAACQVAGVELSDWQTGAACAHPTTTPAPIAPTPDQTMCPLNCNFEENLCGWEQLIQDTYDWTRHSGPTPSDLTGPSEDHTTGAGFYMYLEGDRVTHGDSARLMSSACQYSGPLCLQFWYHMYGSATAMALNIYLLRDNKTTKIWAMMNNQGPQWHPAYADITVAGPFQIIIEGIRGSDAQSDIAIDDISIHFGSCSGSNPGLVVGTERPLTTSEILPAQPVCSIDCSFDSNLCSWNQMVTDAFDWTWQSGSTPTLMTGPSADHTGDGHYLYIEASSVTHGDTARLISSECSDFSPQCLQFWYHMHGSADTMGLHVYLLQNKLADAVFWRRNDQGDAWQLAQVDFTATEAFQIIFEGRRGSNDQSDVAIDDVSLHRGRCADLVKPMTPAPTEFNPITTEGPEIPPVNSSTATTTTTTTAATETHQTSNPDVPTTTTQRPTTVTTTASTTTLFACDTQPSTSRPQTPTTTKPEPQTSTGPQSPTTFRPQTPTETHPQPQTTARPQPPTTFRPQPPTETQPEPQTTAGPQPPTTSRPQPPTETHPQPQTTAGPQPPTTSRPQPPTETHPQPQTTAGPQSPTETHPQPQPTAGPQPPTTSRPQPPTETHPQPQTTAGPQSPTETHPQPQPTAGPQPPTTSRPQPPTETHPQPQPTAGPQPPTSSRPQPPTETHPQPQTTAGPQPPTEIHPQPQPTAGPQPPTTSRPQPPTESQPESQTTVKPQPPATPKPNPPTAGPQPTTTIKPHTTTAGPQPTTTVTPQPSTTARPQPPTTPLPTPSCPQNSHYTTCVPACTPTCSHLNGLPHCSDNQRCEPGCVCNEGFVRKNRACVPIQQCGCVDSNGTKYDFREEWYTSHCSQKCECKERRGVGKIECDDEDECDGNAVCLQNVEGEYYCQSTGFDECTVRSDSEYRTFDRKKYDFEGEHSYVLVQTKNLPNYLHNVYIEGINTRVEDDDDDDSHQHGDSSSEEDHSRRVKDEDEDDSDEDDDDDSEEHEDHHRLQGLKIRVYNHTVEFKKKRRLVVDGRRTNAPVSPAAGLKIYEHSSRIYLKTDFGLSVEFDGHHTAEIILPRIYMRKVGGLCGNFDKDKGNDWTKPDGSRTRDVREFGESWRV
ncbi:zonadhesin isoform X5 [Sparus aurata]|uniref:Zonadhesin n=1 Tax=Sparus aurata TaxID=8175 RepID=A0A671XT28_SPAAU|nr:zonadhesin-like isoform X5 [Sparus aurata]